MNLRTFIALLRGGQLAVLPAVGRATRDYHRVAFLATTVMVQVPDPAPTAGSSFVNQPKSGCAQARCSSRTTRPSFYAPPKHWPAL